MKTNYELLLALLAKPKLSSGR